MAEIKWSNVSGSDLNGAVSNANSAVNNYVRTLFGLGDNIERTADKFQKRADETALWNREQNTQAIINKMHEADSLDALKQMQSQGIGDANKALGLYNGQVDLKSLNNAKKDWIVDTENRASAKDNLLDYSPEQKELISQIQNDLLTGNIQDAQSKLASSNFSNKQKTSLVNSIYKAQEDNRDFNLKHADIAGKFANNTVAVQQAKLEMDKYSADFLNGRGNTAEAQALLKNDPTYLKLLSNYQALEQNGNLLRSQLNTFGSNDIYNGGQYAPKFDVNFEPTQSSISGSKEPKKAEATQAQQTIKQSESNPLTTVASIVNDAVSQPKNKSSEDFATMIADADFKSRISDNIPKDLKSTIHGLINGDLDVTSDKSLQNIKLSEAYLNSVIDEYNKRTGKNIQRVSLPNSLVTAKEWKDNISTRKENLSKDKKLALEEAFGIKNTDNENDLDPVKNLFLNALTKNEWSGDDSKYQSKNDVMEALSKPKYDQKWFDGNDLKERAQKLLEYFEPKEVMRIINSVTDNGTREVNGFFNIGRDEYKQIDNLIRDVKKDPALLKQLRKDVADIDKRYDEQSLGLTTLLSSGQAGTTDALHPSAYGKEYLETKNSVSKKVEAKEEAKNKVNALVQIADEASKNKSINDGTSKVSDSELKTMLEEGTLDIDTQIKAWIALGNKVPKDLDEKELDKIRNTLLELPANQLKQLVQSKVDIKTLKNEADSLYKSLKDEDLLTKDLEKKLKSIK